MKEFLALLYGRWYQTTDDYFDESLDAFNVDPQGERFAPFGIREFVRRFGCSDWLTDEWVYSLLQLREEDFLQLLNQDSVSADDVLTWSALRLLLERDEEDILPRRLSAWATITVPERPAVFSYYECPAYLAVVLTAFRGHRIYRHHGWYDQALPPVERLWAAVLNRDGLAEAQSSREERPLPSYPIYPAPHDMSEADVLLVWQGWEVGLPGCGLKLVDVVVEVLERLAVVSSHRPDAPLEYRKREFSFSSLYSWLQNGEVEWDYD